MADTQIVARRSFLSRLGIGAGALGLGVVSRAQAAPAAPPKFTPAVHPLDDWFDQTGAAKHRFVFDTTTPSAAGASLLYANNYFTANKSGYNLNESDLAIVIVVRHFATPFAFNDTVWKKYGPIMSAMLNFNDPKTKKPFEFNAYNVGLYGMDLPNFGNTLDALTKKGVRYAVCDMATHFVAGQLADKTKGKADDIYKELAANLIPNSHMVPAGIVAVNRAQERGYSFAYVA